jgi:hypothetical protein
MLDPKIDAQLKAITKFPIVIVGTPRSGATALLYYIKTLYPAFVVYEDSVLGPIAEANTDNNFVIKFQTHKFNNYSPEFVRRLLGPNTFKIKTKRHSSVDQAASLYLARERLKWSYTPSDIVDWYFEDAPISDGNIKAAVAHHYIDVQINAIIEQQFNIQYDLELFGDEFLTLGADVPVVTTPKPANYEKIKQLIAIKLEDSSLLPKINMELVDNAFKFIRL